MRILMTLIFALAFFAPSAQAATESEALGTCLADNTNGAERKMLARWVFITMTEHPELHDLTAVSNDVKTQAHKDVAALVTKLLTVNCVNQARAAINQSNGTAMFDSFKKLGEVAMVEIMSNDMVRTAVTEYVQYLDRKKLTDVLRAQ